MLTNEDREKSLKLRGDLIKESFQEQFNKIKRVNKSLEARSNLIKESPIDWSKFDWDNYDKLSDKEKASLAKYEAEREEMAHKAWYSQNL
jgi:hypoxanthine phosphoribosyltransferase